MTASPLTELAPVVEVSHIAGLLRSATSVVLIAHVTPDADALGSALALGLALEAQGTAVQVGFDSPAEVPESLAELPGQWLISRELNPAADLVISLDVASTARLGGLSTLFDAATRNVVIDHHASNPGFGQFNWIDPHAEATAVMVAALIDELGAELTLPMAVNLYAGLATDTVNFRFAGAPAHRLAARLVDAGVTADQVLRPILDTHPFRWLGMLSGVLAGAELDRTVAGGAGLVSVVVTLDAAAGLRREELDSIIDIVRTAAEAEIAAVYKQTGASEWQVSLRSHGAVNVGRVASRLGGGGHPRAAGYGFTGTIDALHDELRTELSSPPDAR